MCSFSENCRLMLEYRRILICSSAVQCIRLWCRLPIGSTGEQFEIFEQLKCIFEVFLRIFNEECHATLHYYCYTRTPPLRLTVVASLSQNAFMAQKLGHHFHLQYPV